MAGPARPDAAPPARGAGPSPSPPASVQVGDRVAIAGHKATVRYVGAVDNQEGAWVGVEWDDDTRGKHDGVSGGRRYFSCASSSSTAGSLVRASKVCRGVSLPDALVLRYTNQVAEGASASAAAAAAAAAGGGASGDGDQQQPFLRTVRQRKVWVELVGEDKVTERQSRTDLLHSARLVGAHVAGAGVPGALARVAPNLAQLDLADNLVSSWATAEAICNELPQLEALVLSHNRLSWPAAGAGGLQRLPGLRCLVLSHCGVDWGRVGVLQAHLPSLQELHVGGNGIASLRVLAAPPAPARQQRALGSVEQQQQQQQQQPEDELDGQLAGFTNLQVLGLEDNAISSWQEVLRLAGLPRLQRLHLSGNPLAHVTYPRSRIPLAALLWEEPPSAAAAAAPHQQQQQQQQPFGALQALLLANCQLSSWADVDQLDAFPALREVRLSGNPLFAAEGAGAGAGAGAGRRYEVIGRVGGLTLLNGADVKPRERRDCELRYLQAAAAPPCGPAAAAAGAPGGQEAGAGGGGGGGGNGGGLEHQHPRLQELRAKYVLAGAVVPAAPPQQGSALGATTAELELRHEGSSLSRKLPRSITVRALRLLCSRLFRLPPDQQQLVLLRPGGGEQQQGVPLLKEEIGGDDTKPLSFWDVADGDAVEVRRVDAGAQRAAAAEAAAEARRDHECRMAQQLQQGEALRSAAAAAGR